MVKITIIIVFLVEVVVGFTLDDLVEDTNWEPTVDASNRRNLDAETQRIADHFTTSNVTDEDFSDDRGKVDCFNFPSGLQKLFRFMFDWSKVGEVRVELYLSTRHHPEGRLWDPSTNTFEGAEMDAEKKLILIVHGFMSNSKMHWVKALTQAILNRVDANVVAVDWESENHSWRYWKAAENTHYVGKEIQRFLNIQKEHGLQTNQIYCIGHSLGSHICSFASQVGKFGRITGLDPAAPCFKGKGLSTKDANHVDVIHTDSYFFGKDKSVGHQDFYPNRGKMQPGCVKRDIPFLKKFPITIKKLKGAICSHGRSYEYLIESIRNTRCKFWGHQWDSTYQGAMTTLKGSCIAESCVPMGLESVVYPSTGDFYLATTEKTPFCILDEVNEENRSPPKELKKCAYKDKAETMCVFGASEDTSIWRQGEKNVKEAWNWFKKQGPKVFKGFGKVFGKKRTKWEEKKVENEMWEKDHQGDDFFSKHGEREDESQFTKQ